MSVAEFDNGYWYATELKSFAIEIGIVGAAALRKDQIEAAIKRYLKTGRIEATSKRQRGPKDVVTLDTHVVNYSNHPSTKEFLEREAQTAPITFRDLVAEYVRLSAHEGPFEKAPVVRYIKFFATS